jgi:hypothetical protein
MINRYVPKNVIFIKFYVLNYLKSFLLLYWYNSVKLKIAYGETPLLEFYCIIEYKIYLLF